MRIGYLLVFLLIGCACADVYEQTCVDVASSAGHTYERLFDGDAMVAVGMDGRTRHAQSYTVINGEVVWLTTTFSQGYGGIVTPILAVGVDAELDTIEFRLSLGDFDKRYDENRQNRSD